MVKWFHLYKDQYFGFWIVGLILFILQEVPYIVMPFITLNSNPVMSQRETSPGLNILEKILGISCVLIHCFIVSENSEVFSLGIGINKAGFILALVILLANYSGWVMYFRGHQDPWIILVFLVALPPLYYAAIGLWRGNRILTVMGIAFGIIHTIHVY